MNTTSLCFAMLLLAGCASPNVPPRAQQGVIDFEDVTANQPPGSSLKSGGHEILGIQMNVKDDTPASAFFAGNYLESQGYASVKTIPAPTSEQVSFSWGCNVPCSARIDGNIVLLGGGGDHQFQYGRKTITHVKNLSYLFLEAPNGVIRLDNVNTLGDQ